MYRRIILIIVCLFFFSPSVLCAGDDVDDRIASMTLRQKVGQLIMIGIRERTLSRQEIMHLKKISPGGIVFYGRNVHHASDIPPLIAQIRESIEEYGLPVFFATDQEGGIVHRVGGEDYKPPSAVTMGATGSEKIAGEVGLSVGSALRTLGINVNLAPVLDVPHDILSAPITPRCFSSTPETVERLGVAYISGIQESGILSAAKHFPGIGRALVDSHYALPSITWKNAREREADLMPFTSAVRSGVDFIMVGHVVGEPGDGKNPVSLSSYWMKNVLRDEIGFEGLFIVDNIEMKPIKDMMPIPKAAVESFRAGADIIMVSHERENQQSVFQAVLHAAEQGDISMQRTDDSLRRILRAKKKLMSRGPENKGVQSLRDISTTVAGHSVIGIKREGAPYFPLSGTGTVLYAGNNLLLYKNLIDMFKTAENMNTTMGNFRKIYPSLNPEDFLRKFDALIIDADYPDAAVLVSFCNALKIPYVVLKIRPSDIRNTLEKLRPVYLLVVFETGRVYLETGLEILSGRRQMLGRLPYDLPLPSGYVYLSPTR